MKILYIGEETRNWVMQSANELVKLGHTVTAVVKRYDEYDDNNKITPIDGVTVLEVDDNAYFNQETVDNTLQDAIRDKLVKASDYASENSYANQAKKLDKVLRGMKNE